MTIVPSTHYSSQTLCFGTDHGFVNLPIACRFVPCLFDCWLCAIVCLVLVHQRSRLKTPSSKDIKVRREYVALVESVKENKGEVRMFSAQHESGKRTDIKFVCSPTLMSDAALCHCFVSIWYSSTSPASVCADACCMHNGVISMWLVLSLHPGRTR
jgi:hypothetical protein